MSVYSIMVFLGQSVGSVAIGWVGMRFGIHWIYGAQGLAGVFSCILNAIVLRETRGDVLLSRKARALTKQTGRLHVCRADLERHSMYTLLTVSIVRPIRT
jgi:MFS family permease